MTSVVQAQTPCDQTHWPVGFLVGTQLPLCKESPSLNPCKPEEDNWSEYASSVASQVVQVVKHNLPMLEMQVRFLGQEDSLEQETASHFSIIAWEIPRTEEPGSL